MQQVKLPKENELRRQQLKKTYGKISMRGEKPGILLTNILPNFDSGILTTVRINGIGKRSMMLIINNEANE